MTTRARADFNFRSVRLRDAPPAPYARRLVFSEQAQEFWGIFGDSGMKELMKEMRDMRNFYWQARAITPSKEQKNIRGIAQLAVDQATAMRSRNRRKANDSTG